MPPIEQLHPAVVHFPIVLALLLLAVDFTAVARGGALTRGAHAGNLSAAIAVLAAVAALAAFMFGDIAYDVAAARGVPETVLETHEGLGSATAFAILGWGALRGLAWQRAMPIEGSARWPVVAMDAVLVAMVLATALFGGQLVYEYGVGVASSVRVAG